MNSRRIGIIGINGSVGSFLQRFFEKQEYEVIGSDKDTPLTNSEVAEKADALFFCAPALVIPRIISELVQYQKKDKLLVSMSSLMKSPIEEMMKSEAEVAGLHGLGAPPKEGTSLKGQVMNVWQPRIRIWRTWIAETLEKLEVTVAHVDPETHDDAMLLNQNLVHELPVLIAAAAMTHEIRPDNLLLLSTPQSRKLYGIIARILSNKNLHLYANIQMANPKALETIDVMVSELSQIREFITKGNVEGFVAKLKASKLYLGEPFLKKALELNEKPDG